MRNQHVARPAVLLCDIQPYNSSAGNAHGVPLLPPSVQWHRAVNLLGVRIYPAGDIPQLCESLQQHEGSVARNSRQEREANKEDKQDKEADAM